MIPITKSNILVALKERKSFEEVFNLSEKRCKNRFDGILKSLVRKGIVERIVEEQTINGEIVRNEYYKLEID